MKIILQKRVLRSSYYFKTMFAKWVWQDLWVHNLSKNDESCKKGTPTLIVWLAACVANIICRLVEKEKRRTHENIYVDKYGKVMKKARLRVIGNGTEFVKTLFRKDVTIEKVPQSSCDKEVPVGRLMVATKVWTRLTVTNTSLCWRKLVLDACHGWSLTCYQVLQWNNSTRHPLESTTSTERKLVTLWSSRVAFNSCP